MIITAKSDIKTLFLSSESGEWAGGILSRGNIDRRMPMTIDLSIYQQNLTILLYIWFYY